MQEDGHYKVVSFDGYSLQTCLEESGGLDTHNNGKEILERLNQEILGE